MDLTEAQKIAQAVAEGYPDVDETCSACGTVFKNYHHFIRCERKPCPMSTGKTLFEHWAELDAQKATESSIQPKAGGIEPGDGK